jgi:excisionase family DNA binding protein
MVVLGRAWGKGRLPERSPRSRHSFITECFIQIRRVPCFSGVRKCKKGAENEKKSGPKTKKALPWGFPTCWVGVGCLPDQLMPFQETGHGPVDVVPVADPNDLLTPSDAARVLGLSPDSVRVLSDSGRLPAMRTVSGRRLFRRSDVDRLAAERARHSASVLAARAQHAASQAGDALKKT